MDLAKRLTALIQEYSIPLIVGVVAGLAAANIDIHSYETLVDYPVFGPDAALFGHHITVHFLINEVFMVFFFGVAAKEITEAFLPGGVLNPLQRAINPLMGTLGGVLGPAAVYLLLTMAFFGGSDDFATVARGWAIPTATDIALAWLVARLVFGPLHPAVSFLLLLAVADDALGLGIIAVFYPDPDLPVQPAWLLLTVAGMGAALKLRQLRVDSWLPYVIIGGVMSWVGLAKAAIEPALALVVIVPFLPGPQNDSGPDAEPVETGTEVHVPLSTVSHAHGSSPLERFEHQLKLFVDVGLFFFAFVNAGVAFGTINQVTIIILLSLLLGKTVGVTLFSLAAQRVGFPLPLGMAPKHLIIAGLISGIGLTVALFVAGKAFPGPPFQDPAKMGAVLSIFVGLLAIVAGALAKVKDGAGTE
ncbi:MAG: hypothetical protein BZY80_05460 [SAR202 cluster bacterium Io17-Chloro-G2]|nr:MAG: hypothetical protein BZY80_05460 [SAR202 cluster bacterium Io17-Chloro-G2]